MNQVIEFQRLREADLALVSRWKNTPHVAEWYGIDEGEDSSLEGVRAKYLPFINGDTRTTHYIFTVDAQPAGLIQWYLMRSWPQYLKAIRVEPESVSVDLFIGEVESVHRGLGPKVISKFLKEIVFPNSNAEHCYIGPAVPNQAARKAYAKVGFGYVKTVEVPGEAHPEYIMRLAKSEVVDC